MSKRLIYEEDAIEWVENILEVDKYYHPHAKSRNVPIDEVIDRLKRVPSAQPEQRWIPCSERLPDKSGTYICNCVESDINHVTFIKWQSRYKRWDLNGRRTFWRVTAWKPIPEPYERRQG